MGAISPQDSFSIDLAIQELGSSPGLDTFQRICSSGRGDGVWIRVGVRGIIGSDWWKSCEEQGQAAPQGPGLLFSPFFFTASWPERFGTETLFGTPK